MPSGRTSTQVFQANDLLATLPACSEKRHNQPCRRPHEHKLVDQTKDDVDKVPREERSCGRSQPLLYNPKRRHSTIGYLSPMEFERQAGLA
jgi:transposase InsO family protein